MLQQMLAILLVLALLAATLFVLRRKGFAQFPRSFPKAQGRAKEMTLLERLPLSPQHSLQLVQVRDEVFLIGTSPSGCANIASFKC